MKKEYIAPKTTDAPLFFPQDSLLAASAPELLTDKPADGSDVLSKENDLLWEEEDN